MQEQYYDHSKKSDKYYFGGFFNLAQNNIDLVLDAYKKRFKENNLDKLKNTNLSDTDFNLRVDYLGRHLPFVLHLDKTNRENFGSKVAILIKAVDSLRNFYTHHFHKPLSFDENFYSTLDDLFLQVVKDVRKDRMKTDKTKLLLNKGLEKELKMLFDEQKKNLQQKKAQGRNNDDNIRNSIWNQAFNHLTSTTKKDENGENVKDKEGKTIKVAEYVKDRYKSELANEDLPNEDYNGITISRSGIVFLLGLFLNKKESEHLRAHIKGFKAKTTNETPTLKWNSLKFMATHWVFSHLSFKGVKAQLVNSTFKEDKEQFGSSYDKETLLIQIADELSKVPNAVYHALPKELQNTFEEDINEYLKEDRDNTEWVVHPVTRKRSEDREDKFNYFALRYLDKYGNFPTLRFQLHLGNYVHDRREKTIGETTLITDRTVKEKINVFARLSEASKLKYEALKDKDGKELIGWEQFPNPHYNIEEGNIMIYLQIKDDNLKKQIKEYRDKRKESENRIRRGGNKASKYKITGEIGNKFIINFYEPVAVLSLNELPALLYELLAKETKTTPEQIEDRLCKCIKEQFDKIENIETERIEQWKKNKTKSKEERLAYHQTEGHWSFSQYPSKLLNSSTNDSSIDIQKLLKEIEKEIKITTDKLALIEKNRAETTQLEKGKPVRKYIFYSRELGQEATWLAYDLVRLMPTDVRNNWKGYQHSQLQQSLAFYDTRPQEAFGILKEVWGFNNDAYSWNKGIKKAFNKKSFDQFFEEYLNARLNIYRTLAGTIKNIGNKELLYQSLKRQRVWTLFPERDFRIDITQTQKERLLAKPIVLGRGIFDDKPTFIKGVKLNEETEKQFADWYGYAALSKEEFQRFYDYERDYTKLFNFKENKEGQEKDRKKTIEKLAIENDLYIKKQKTQDLFLKLIVKQLYQEVFGEKMPFSLADFYLTQKERRIQEAKADKQNQREVGDKSENIIKENYLWSKTIPYNHGEIEEPAIKLKDVGKFKRFLLDKRVTRILEYPHEGKWTKLALEKEIDSYEENRIELLKDIQELEKSIFDGENLPIKLQGRDKKTNEPNGNPSFKHYIANGLLAKRADVSDEDKEWLLDKGKTSFEEPATLECLKTKSETIQKAFMLVYIRNKIGHNQMPTKDLFDFMLELCGEKQLEKETFSDVIWKCTEKIIA